MIPQISEEELYKQAREIVEAKKGFFIHLAVYLVVSAALYVIWQLTWQGYPWYIWPIFGWGVGILFHFLGVFVFSGKTDWERRQIEKEMQRLRNDMKQ